MAASAGMGMGGQCLGCYNIFYSAGQNGAPAPSQIPARASGGRSVDLGVYASNLNHASTEIAMASSPISHARGSPHRERYICTIPEDVTAIREKNSDVCSDVVLRNWNENSYTVSSRYTEYSPYER
ncbi:hypothetical protein KOW79_001929 [Hemibagrus wyckioides]|uniref:Uncharacterized protein n=1 Tax=Hemibagrus wyckioides TaxID=337641 RepID=A0A9D3P617_9TELE|nr:hypothetical protein KOW79_001929 [Hemibagrus wyckioides]